MAGSVHQVLIIDDCEEDREVYRRYLSLSQCQSYEICMTESAEEAFSVCQERAFDVLLLDYELPDLTGLEFLARWQSRSTGSTAILSTAIIMLTAFGDEAVAVQALKQGAHDYLVKQSVTPDSLQHAIHISLEQIRLRQALQQSQEQQRLIAMTALKIRDSLDLAQILETTTAEIQQLLRCDRAAIYKMALGGLHSIVSEAVSDPFPSALRASLNGMELVMPTSCPISFEARLGKAPSSSHAALGHTASVEPTQLDQVQQACLDPAQRDALSKLQVKALLEIPIVIEGSETRAGNLWGILVLHQCQDSRVWRETEVEMLQAISTHLAIAIQQSELLTQTQCALVKEKELNTFKSHIVTTVSHEYRTPITTILAAASTLDKHSKSLGAERNQKLLQMIEQQARHLRNLVDDMLVVNQVELGQIRFKPFPLNIEQFFLSLIEEYQITTHKSHPISFEMSGSCEDFWGDIGLLRQIFGNLLSNAIKYSPEGGDIHLSAWGDEDGITFKVMDQGIGIPPDEVALLFQSFKRARNVDTIAGTGLGLTITQSCVMIHRGQISISSQLNQFTEVVVWLPKRSPQIPDQR